MEESEVCDKKATVKADCGENSAVHACCCKTTVRTEDEKTKLINRLSRIEGQIRGLKGMIEKDAYCTDVLTQSAAAVAAINSFNKDLLACHIRGCVVKDIRNGNDGVIDDLVSTIQKLMK